MLAPDRPIDELDLHQGLDCELDLAAERPSADPAERRRGPEAMVAAIVVSALGLAMAINFVRGDESPPPEPESSPVPVARAVVSADDPPPPVTVPSSEPSPSAASPAAVVQTTTASEPSRLEIKAAEVMTPAAIASPRAHGPRVSSHSEHADTERSRALSRWSLGMRLPAPPDDEPPADSDADSPFEPSPVASAPEPHPRLPADSAKSTESAESTESNESNARESMFEPTLPGQATPVEPGQSEQTAFEGETTTSELHPDLPDSDDPGSVGIDATDGPKGDPDPQTETEPAPEDPTEAEPGVPAEILIPAEPPHRSEPEPEPSVPAVPPAVP